MTSEEIRNIIESNPLTYFGLRSDARSLNIGDLPGNSHHLLQDPEYDCDGELIYPEGEGQYAGYYDAGELPGTCAIMIDADTDIEEILDYINDIYGYYGGNIYLIGGNDYCEGLDEGEAIISNAAIYGKIN